MQFITLDTVDDPRVEAYVSLTEMRPIGTFVVL